jgi:hypothetical protein
MSRQIKLATRESEFKKKLDVHFAPIPDLNLYVLDVIIKCMDEAEEQFFSTKEKKGKQKRDVVIKYLRAKGVALGEEQITNMIDTVHREILKPISFYRRVRRWVLKYCFRPS